MSPSLLDETVYATYVDRLLAGDRAFCANTVRELLDKQVGVPDIYVELFQRSLYDVGALWEHNKISVAIEHMATAITESLLTLVYPILFRAERVKKKAVIACVANEYHQVGAKMVADIFELHGWDSFFLGANTPVKDLIDLLSQTTPDTLGLSLSVYFNLPRLTEVIESVRKRFPMLPILVGGQAFASGGKQPLKVYSGIRFVPTLSQLQIMLQENSVNG
jgi:MerR family transcriptional regulator, light-induced transcriptional regulator